MTQLLISFCNVFPKGLALGIYDYDKEEFGWIDFHKINENVMGSNGISSYNEKYYVVTQLQVGGVSGLVAFNKQDLQILDIHRLKESNDAHSLIAHDNGFLIADTGKNRLVKITLTNRDTEINETEFWSYNNDGKDTVHLNSMAKLGNEIFVTIFGTKPQEGWKKAKFGKIINITTNQTVFENLHHPHSITVIDEKLLLL